MDSFGKYLINLLSQFAGGRGELGNELVRFGLGMFFWGILLAAARIRSRGFPAPREKLLLWGFAAGFIRETLMFIVFSLEIEGHVNPTKLHAFFPPAEHALLMVSVVIVSAAFLQYLLDDSIMAMRYLKIGLTATAGSYLITFVWWASYITRHPESKFGQVWCDWIFHVMACILIGYAISRILKRPGWVGGVVGLALFLFFLDEFVKLIDIGLGERYEDVLAPIRHSFHLAAILLLGYVYWHEQFLERKRLEKRVLDISDLEKRQIGQELHDGLIQQLTGISFFTELLSKKINQGQLPDHQECREVTAALQDAITQARAISAGLYPVELERAGLRTALEELTQSNSKLYGHPCIFRCRANIDDYPIETATHIYRILQESISNAARHAGASEITLDVYPEGHDTVFEVLDDGSGIDLREVQKGMGMQTMRYRASLISANLAIAKRFGGGTGIRLVCLEGQDRSKPK